MQIKEFAKYINLATLAVVSIEDTEYRVYKYKDKKMLRAAIILELTRFRPLL